MSIHVICAGKYNESSYERLCCEITPYVYKNKCGWKAANNGSLMSVGGSCFDLGGLKVRSDEQTTNTSRLRHFFCLFTYDVISFS